MIFHNGTKVNFMEESSLGIAFGSISTGLPKDIVQQIMAAEKIPLKKMEGRKAKVENKKALLTDLTGRVENMRGFLASNANARALREIQISSNEEIVGITADKNIAQPGNYQFEVISLAQKSSAMTAGFEDPEESYVGVGFIQYHLPNGDTKDIYIDSDNASLNSISKLINKDTENGLRANVINDGSGTDNPWRLVLSLEDTGDEAMAEFPYFYFVDGEDDMYLEFERPAHDAKVKLDGFEIELPSNKAKDLIPGLTIDLKKARPGEEFSINIDEDSEAVTTKVVDLVEQINSVIDFINEQNKLDEKTDTSQTLGGDVMLQTLESRIRSTVFKNIKTEFGNRRFGDLGVKFQRNGRLELDEKAFNAKLNANYEEVSQILTGRFLEGGVKEKGFMDHLNDMVKMSLRFPDGLLVSRKRSFQTNTDQIDRRISQRQRMLETKEKNLKDKFARLEGTISRIKAQGAGVAALGASAGSPVTQLG
jgi:flagellar hook-associated protein 2